MLCFYVWNLSIIQIIVPLPYLLQFPRFLSGEIKLGAMSQSASAFGSIQDGLSFFRNAYDQFAGYRAAIIRLHGLVEANDVARALP
jgi:putative ATP-binding cassette transporter